MGGTTGASRAPVLSLREVTVDDYLNAYSDHVALAVALADYRPRLATSHARSERLIDELDRRVEWVFAERRGSSPALEQWLSDQIRVMRRPTGPLTPLLRPVADASSPAKSNNRR